MPLDRLITTGGDAHPACVIWDLADHHWDSPPMRLVLELPRFDNAHSYSEAAPLGWLAEETAAMRIDL